MSLINQMLQDLDRRHVSMVGSIPLETVRTGESTAPFTPVKSINLKLATGLIGLSLCAGAGWYAATQLHLPLLKIVQQHPSTLQAEVISSANANMPEKTKPKASNIPAGQISSVAQQTPTSATQAETTNAALLQAKIEEISQLKAQLQQMATEATSPQLMASPTLAQTPAPATTVKHTAVRRLNTTSVADNAPIAQLTATDKTSADVKTENIKISAAKPQFNKQISPEQASDAAYSQALSMLQLGRAPEAQELLTKALTFNPNNHDARQTLVGVLVELKRNSEAIEYLKAGLLLEPQQIGFSQMLARLLIENNQRADAMTVLVKALPYAREDAQYHAFLAALLQSEEKHKEAIEHYLIALKHGNQANWLVGLGISLQAEGRMQDAHDIYTRAQNTQLNADLAQFVEQRIKQVQQQLN